MKNGLIKKYTGTETLENMNQAKFYNKWTLNKFKDYLTGSILDVGCGIGNFTATLSKYGKVTAIDIDKSLIQNLKNEKNPCVIVGYGDIEEGKYFFKKQTFDTIVCLNVLEHIKDDKTALQNMYNLLSKGGKLILLVPIHNFLYGEIDRAINHFRRYNPRQFKKQLEQTGFIIEKSRKLNFLGALGWFIASKILKEKNVEERNIKIFNLIAPFVLPLEDLFEPPIGTSILAVAKKTK